MIDFGIPKKYISTLFITDSINPTSEGSKHNSNNNSDVPDAKREAIESFKSWIEKLSMVIIN